MENAVEALKMAGSVLLFILALSVAILAFTKARQTVDVLISYADREYFTIENDERFYYLPDEEKENRYVNLETIIPAMYRAFTERYKIIFKYPGSDKGDYIYSYEDKEKDIIDESNIIDMDENKETFGNENLYPVFIKALLYGEDKIKVEEPNLYSQLKRDNNLEIKTPLYETFFEGNNYLIKESIGVFKDKDLTEADERIEDINKQDKRVITYTFIQK